MWFRPLRCSFCRRPDREVDKLVAGARGYICDRCAREVMRIIESTPPDRETFMRAAEVQRRSTWHRSWYFGGAGKLGIKNLEIRNSRSRCHGDRIRS